MKKSFHCYDFVIELAEFGIESQSWLLSSIFSIIIFFLYWTESNSLSLFYMKKPLLSISISNGNIAKNLPHKIKTNKLIIHNIHKVMFRFLLSSTTLLIFFDAPIVSFNGGGFGMLFISRDEEFAMWSGYDEVIELRDDVEENIVDEPILFKEVFELVRPAILCLSMISGSMLLFIVDMESFFDFLLLKIFFICHKS